MFQGQYPLLQNQTTVVSTLNGNENLTVYFSQVNLLNGNWTLQGLNIDIRESDVAKTLFYVKADNNSGGFGNIYNSTIGSLKAQNVSISLSECDMDGEKRLNSRLLILKNAELNINNCNFYHFSMETSSTSDDTHVSSVIPMGIINISEGKMHVLNTTFTKNSIENLFPIYPYNNRIVSVTDSSFINNFGCFLLNNNILLHIENSKFINNSLVIYSGGRDNYEVDTCEIFVKECTFSVMLKNKYVLNIVVDTTVTFIDSFFLGEDLPLFPLKANPLVLMVTDYPLFIPHLNASITNCTFTGRLSVMDISHHGKVSIGNCTIMETSTYGSLIKIRDKTNITIIDTIITDNMQLGNYYFISMLRSSSVEIQNCFYANNNLQNHISAADRSNVSVQNTIFVNNTASNHSYKSPIFDIRTGVLLVQKCHFENNYGNLAIILSASDSAIEFYGNVFEKNKRKSTSSILSFGTMFDLESSNFYITNCSFENNTMDTLFRVRTLIPTSRHSRLRIIGCNFLSDEKIFQTLGSNLRIQTSSFNRGFTGESYLSQRVRIAL